MTDQPWFGGEPRQYTTKEKLSNWFYYNKWWIVIGAVIVWVVGSMIWNVLGIGQAKPDYRIAYVGQRQLPQDCVDALESALASLADDQNGDGVVTVALTQHVTANTSNLENMVYTYAAEVTVLADITEGESTFFLLEDPRGFQLSFQILAHLDGSIPAADDFEAMDKVYAWKNCPALASLELGEYTDSYLDQTETGLCQDLLQNLYLGRRYFYDPDQQKNPGGDDAFWKIITEGAVS